MEKKLTDSEIYEKFIKNSDFSDVSIEPRCCPDCVIGDLNEVDESGDGEKEGE